ncbi:MAG: amidohydrolase [Bacteroidia bacterium]|nr:amidohydrolase [Bacteroidia bacterium]
MKPIHVTALQLDLAWEAPAVNRQQIETRLRGVKTDLIILPEMFTTGFSMNAAALAEDMDNSETLSWMEDIAQGHQALVCGSLIIRDGGKYYNRFVFVSPDEGLSCEYDKRHLFALGGEDKPYTAGDAWTWMEWKGWRIVPQICYDLRFPVWSRNRRLEGGGLSYDLLIYAANWPARRTYHWETLLRARAIENQAFVVGVNRVGTDGTGLEYVGRSVILDPAGNPVAQCPDEPATLEATLDPAVLQDIREKLPFWRDADAFDVYA